ncbi:LysR family transcriptional regulator [Actinoallomurus iriomotensis]|uniref:LysR family transcriptional regulator n=1 Tax=Actinoallomurus iriomotensis TaxID=478107 RepID=A0A9W6VN02_9ACTN|nr:LysR family transcriptional regulator [Actinoallomurus iriomotensis]GLY72952.1 LysR family transcriptional regulator [Actinoallomurus iriomotensis]
MPDDPSPPAGPDLRLDLELRLVRYFTVVAEHLNFGRAAAALHVAQPSLSRQIQRLEDQLGVRLFDRTPQGSRLTEAGQAFLPQARALLRAANQAALTARAAAPPRAITIGYVADLVVTPAVGELRRRHPDAQVRTRHLDWKDTHALPQRQVDVLVARLPLPFEADHLRVTVLYEEPRVVVMPLSHRLAGKESIGIDDLTDEELVACTSTPTIWSTPRPLGPGPGGTTPAGPSADDSFEDKLELVAGGHSIAILPAGDRRSTLRDDLATIPITGIDPCQVVVVTHANDHNPLVTAFREIAERTLGQVGDAGAIVGPHFRR